MRKYILLTLLIAFLLLDICSYAIKNDSVVDSLSVLLNNEKTDKLKVNNDIAEYLLSENDTSLVYYINQGLSSSSLTKSVVETIRAYKILGAYYKKNYNYHFAINDYFTALSLAETREQKTDLSIQIAICEIGMEEYMEALEYLRQSKSYLLDTENNELWYKAYLYEGISYFELSDYGLARLRWEKAAHYANKLNSNIHRAEINSRLGEISIYQNEYITAFKYLNNSIQESRADSNSNTYAYALKNIGHLYKINQNYVDAKLYYNTSETIFNLLGNNNEYARSLIEDANICVLQNDQRNAYTKYDEAKRIFKATEYTKGLAEAHKGMAICLRKNGDLNLAYSELNNAAKYSKNNFSDLLISQIKLEFSEWHFQKNNYDSALYYTQSALQYLKKTNNLVELAYCYNLLSDIQFVTKDYKNSALTFRESTTIKDSIYSIINSQEFKYLQSKYAVERKQDVINVLTQEKQRREKTIKQNKITIEKQKAFILLGVIVLAFLSILAFILGSWLNQKRIANKKLQQNNNQIAQQKEEIEVQKQHLQEINTEHERLSIIAQETDNGVKIMNPVGRILWVNEGYTRMYGYTLENLQGVESINLLGNKSSIDIHSLVSVWYGDKKPITFESLNEKKNGEEIWVQTTLTPVLDEAGRIAKMIAIDSDITRLKKAEAVINAKNIDITASIAYAKKIQEAIMFPIDKLADYFPESFCFYKPKSIVSGDFYWFSEQHDRIVIACADSTGHGVPGAFMSLIGISFLNKIVNEKGFVSPSIILNRMRDNIITHLHHSNNDSIAGDGMDMSIISVDKKNNSLEYAGAMNPLYIIRDNNLIELKADRMPVGFFDNEDRPFSSTSISLKTGDHIYMFTDGYYDQFGGEDDSKMKTHKFKDLLKSCYNKKAADQKQIIEDYFYKWKGEKMQIDDILIMGIVIN